METNRPALPGGFAGFCPVCLQSCLQQVQIPVHALCLFLTGCSVSGGADTPS